MMDSLTEWLDFIDVDIFMLMALTAGCLLLGRGRPVRKYVVARAALAIAAQCLWAYTLSYLWLHSGWASGYLGAVVVSKYMGTFLLTILSFWFCWECGFFVALFCGMTAYILQHCSERLLELLRLPLGDVPGVMDHILLVGITTAVYLVYAVLFLRNFSVTDYEKYEKEGNHITLLTAAATVGVIVLIEPLIRGEIGESGNTRLLFYVNSISVLLSVLALLISMCQLREADFIKRNEITAQLLYNERKQYALEKETVEAINVKCHDIRHQLAALGQANTAYQQELQKIGELVSVYDCNFKTENPALDLILSNKSLACSSKKIVLTCMAEGSRLGFMEDSEIYALFGNILDNAIEAVDQIADPEKRLITLTVQGRQGLVFIHAENYYSGQLRFEGGLPQTTKADKQHHGFGMRSIQLLTEKYGGDLRIKTEEGVYMLSIMFPEKE